MMFAAMRTVLKLLEEDMADLEAAMKR